MLTLKQCMMILESIDGLVYADEKGIIQYIDEKTARGMKLTQEDFVGKYVQEMLPLTKIHTVLETRQSSVGDFYFIEDKEHWEYPIVVSTQHPVYNGRKFAGVIEFDIFQNYKVLKQFIKNTEGLVNDLTLFRSEKNKKNSSYTLNNIVGSSPHIKKLKKEIIQAANSQSSVVITGETGSGKELVSKSIHYLSRRKRNAFIAINCSAIPIELFESELFGYEEGSFTNARRGGKIGKFELANNGTIFLDEINSLPLALQPKLLRALQEGEIDRIGGKYSIPVDVRVISATNRPLEELVEKNEFRQDLYFRLNVFPIHIPPLRERMEDIEDLSYSIIKNLNSLIGRNISYITPEVIETFQHYHWPGNVRELQNILERAMNKIDVNAQTLDISLFSDFTSRIVKKNSYNFRIENPIANARNNAERDIIMQALKAAEGNKTKAAKILKISRQVLYKKLKKFKIDG